MTTLARRAAAAICGTLLCAACGTTVQGTGSSSLSPASTNGNSAGAPARDPVGGPNTSGAPGAAGTAAPVIATASAGGAATGAQSGAAAAAGGGAATIPASGRGWNQQYIDVGVTTNQDVQTFAHTLGVNSLDSGDQKADAEAMISAINSAGGLYGRKLRGIYLDIKTTDDPNSSAQASCAYFTQDHPVVAVINGAVENDQQIFRDCMTKNHVPILALGDTPLDDKAFHDAHGYYAQMIVPSWNRLAPVYAQRLAALGYFHPWDAVNGRPGTAPVKVGIIALDTPIGHRVAAIIGRAFAAVGHAPADYFYWANQSDLQAAVLHFRSDNVTHVLDIDQFLFEIAEQAESQHYRPRYAVTSVNAPYELLQSVVPPQQLTGALGAGFDPGLDVAATQDPNATATASACRAIMRRHGVNYGGQRFADAYSLGFCDAFNALVAAARAGDGLQPTQLLSGVAGAGPQLRPASTFRSGLSGSDLSLPGSVVDLGWDGDCGCFRYLSRQQHEL